MSLREEGNKLFRQGRWSRAAELYERAVAQDARDAKAWSNLAQARLNMQEFARAASAATRAHELDPTAPKPLYRLALAQRGMNDPREALETLKAAPSNPEIEALRAELKEEVERLPKPSTAVTASKSPGSVDSAKSGPPQRATSATDAAKGVAKAEEEKKVASEDIEMRDAEKEKEDKGSAPSTSLGSLNSFAALKAAKAARRSYADAGGGMPGLVPVSTTRRSPSGSPAPASAPSTAPPSSAAAPSSSSAPCSSAPASLLLPSAPALSAPTASAATTSAPADTATSTTTTPSAPTSQAPALPPPPPNPHSLAPGTGLSLLRTLSTLSSQAAYTYLRYYPASIIPKLVTNLLEPDTLGLLLRTLDAGRGTGSDGWIEEVMQGLRENRRWKMTALMLSKGDREALGRLTK